MVTTVSEKSVEEMVMEAEKAPEPGRDILIEKNANPDIQLSVAQLNSAGWTYIYDTKTGEQSITNKNMLSTQLGKLRPDGTRYFTTARPPFLTVKRGHLKCLLHPDDPNRAHYDEMGLPVCGQIDGKPAKSNLTSIFEVRNHMMKKHKREWQIIETERIDTEKTEERDFQRSLLKTASQNQAQAPTKTAKVTGTEERPLYVKGL